MNYLQGKCPGGVGEDITVFVTYVNVWNVLSGPVKMPSDVAQPGKWVAGRNVKSG